MQVDYTGTFTATTSMLRNFSGATAGGHATSISGNATRPDTGADPTLPRAIVAGAFRDAVSSVRHVLTVNTTGTYKVQWAQNTSDAGNTRLHAGAYLMARKLN
jgi:hypothetical protein